MATNCSGLLLTWDEWNGQNGSIQFWSCSVNLGFLWIMAFDRDGKRAPSGAACSLTFRQHLAVTLKNVRLFFLPLERAHSATIFAQALQRERKGQRTIERRTGEDPLRRRERVKWSREAHGFDLFANLFCTILGQRRGHPRARLLLASVHNSKWALERVLPATLRPAWRLSFFLLFLPVGRGPRVRERVNKQTNGHLSRTHRRPRSRA